MANEKQECSKIRSNNSKYNDVGIDIAKEIQWSGFIDCRGLEIRKAVKFQNNKNGFGISLSSIKAIGNSKKFNKVIVGMEPTGHYWKPLAHF
ncbi:MAG: IS110 family transposase [Bacillota bacterium]